MIHQDLLNSLSENQICFLSYILNKNSGQETYTFESLRSVRVEILKKSLEKNRANVKEEYLQEYQSLCEKFGLT